MDCKGIIFDMDGTLVDSMGMWYQLGTMILEESGLTSGDPELNRKVCWMTIPEMKDFFEKEYGIHCGSLEEFVQLYYRGVDKRYAADIAEKSGVREFLERARAAGIRMCVATATRTSSAEMVLRRLGLLPYFEFVLSCDDVGKSKKYPDVYLEAARRLGLSVSDCVVFEDALQGVRTAKAAGFRVAAIYEKASDWEAEEIRRYCDCYITEYEEIMHKN